MTSQTADVIVVGAGSAGGVLASRLSEDPGCRVLLLEAGADFPDEATDMPAFYVLGATAAANGLGSGAPTPEYDWGYVSEPLADGRRFPLLRGKMVGGTSMINGCAAVRPRPADFDRWLDLGADEWGWSDVLPYFERVEATLPLKAHDRTTWPKITNVVAEGFEELGHEFVDELNDPGAWGRVVGATPQNRRNAIRLGTLPTYIRSARERPNFEIQARALVDRVLFDRSRAIGVRYVDESGRLQTVAAEKVVLAAGAYGSPQILLRSGIGPAAEIRRLGLETRLDLPVGEGLLDHPACLFMVRTPVELAGLYGPHMAATIRGEEWFASPFPMDEEEGRCGIVFLLTTDHGRGSIRLSSTRPDARPQIDHDPEAVVSSGSFASVWQAYRGLLESEAFRAGGVSDLSGDGDPEALMRQFVGSGQHPAGGCAIGQVTDAGLAVLGTESLYVADASVFPSHVSSNPNLTCFMVGERAADLIGPGASAN